jgi:hypothetical protein
MCREDIHMLLGLGTAAGLGLGRDLTLATWESIIRLRCMIDRVRNYNTV